MSSSAGRVDLDLGINYNAFQRQLSGIAGNATNMVGGAFKKLGAVIAGAFAVGSMVNFGREAINLASDLQEVENVVNVTFGNMAAEIDAWSNQMLHSFGLSELSAKRYASTMGAMLKSSGLAGTQMKDMSKNLTELAADMASFYNLSTDEAYYKVFAGMTGETEPLKALGVNLSVANIEAYALSQGINKSYQAMTQAEQTLLRYGYLLSVTGDAQGDFARNGDSWANQIRVLTEQWRIFQGTMGAGFINILTPTIKWINALIGRLQVAAQYFRAFTEIVFGAQQVASESAVTANAAAASMGGIGEEAAKTANGIKKAAKAAKGLSALDQFNLIKTTAKDAAGGAGDIASALGGIGGGMDIGTVAAPELDVDPIKEQVQGFIEDIKGMFASGGWNIEPLKNSLKGLGEAVKPFAKNVGQGLKWFLFDVLIPIGKWTITKALPAFLDVLSAGIRILTTVIEAFVPYGKILYDNILKPLAEWSGGLIVSALQLLAQGLNQLSDWINNNQDAVINGALFIASFFAAFKIAGLILALGPLITSLGAFVSTIVALITSGGLVPVILGAISAAISAIMSPIVLITAALGLLIYSFIDLYNESETFRQSLVELGRTWLSALQPLADFVKTVLVDAWKQILKPVIDFFINKLIPNLIDIFKMLWEDVLVPLANFIGTVLKPVFQILADLLMMLWKNVVLPLAKAIGGVLAEAWDAIYSILTKTIIPVIKNVISVFQFLWDKVINPLITHLWNKLKPAFETVFKTIGTVINGLKDVLVGIIRFITGVFTGDWQKAWDGIKLVFKGVWDSLVGIVKGVVNIIIDLVNSMIKNINKFSIDVPDWVATLTGMKGGKFGFNIPEIPKLATGGLVSAPTLAMVGDNRNANVDPEVVSPLSKLQDMLSGTNAMSEALLMSMLEVLREIARKDPAIRIGDTELGRAATRSSNKLNRLNGRTALEI